MSNNVSVFVFVSVSVFRLPSVLFVVFVFVYFSIKFQNNQINQITMLLFKNIYFYWLISYLSLISNDNHDYFTPSHMLLSFKEQISTAQLRFSKSKYFHHFEKTYFNDWLLFLVYSQWIISTKLISRKQWPKDRFIWR